MELSNDLLEVIGYYTIPFVTYDLITINKHIANRLVYGIGHGTNTRLGNPGFWLSKVQYETKISRTDLATYYNDQIEDSTGIHVLA